MPNPNEELHEAQAAADTLRGVVSIEALDQIRALRDLLTSSQTELNLTVDVSGATLNTSRNETFTGKTVNEAARKALEVYRRKALEELKRREESALLWRNKLVAMGLVTP